MLRNTLSPRCLPYALKRIADRLTRAREPFGLFVLRNDILLIKTATTRFESELKRASVQQHLVGVY
ncbi:MAG: hypothetical protein KGL61_00030, partial [Burkholderiales bacterium]|nr:hypothetical protein [Burkholderiales bacterium]